MTMHVITHLSSDDWLALVGLTIVIAAITAWCVCLIFWRNLK